MTQNGEQAAGFKSCTVGRAVLGTSRIVTGVALGAVLLAGCSPAPAADSAPSSQTSATATASARPSATVTKGGSAVGVGGCTDPSCANLALTVADFPAGTYDVTCQEGVGVDAVPFWTQEDVVVPSDGTVELVCFSGFPGSTVSLRVGEKYETPALTW